MQCALAATKLSVPQTAAQDDSTFPPAFTRLQQVDTLVRALVASWHDSRISEHRHWHRVSYPLPIAVTPLDGENNTPAGLPLAAVGHNISARGMSFTHRDLLPCRCVAITLRQDEGTLMSVAVRLSWCRFTSDAVYKSGGKFVRVLAAPVCSEDEWTALSAESL